MRENWPVARRMQPGLGWMSTVGLSSKMLPKDELSWRSLPPPSIISLKPYFLCILPDYRFFFGFTTIYRFVQYFFWQKDITGVEGRERVSYQSRIPVPAVGLEVSIPVLTYIQRDLVSTARAVRAILFIQSVETLCAVIQGGGTAIVRHWHRLHVLIDDEWRKYKKTIVQWVFSRLINCTHGCTLLVFLAKKSN